jgi:hypothetical protein
MTDGEEPASLLSALSFGLSALKDVHLETVSKPDTCYIKSGQFKNNQQQQKINYQYNIEWYAYLL